MKLKLPDTRTDKQPAQKTSSKRQRVDTLPIHADASIPEGEATTVSIPADTDAFARFAQNKKTMLEMLVRSLGIVTTAAKQAGIGRRTHYDWMDADIEYRKVVEDIENVALDFAESALHKQISNGEVASTIFYLKTKGKNRGYIERTEVTGKNGKDLIPFNWDIINNENK